jgi:hypothetical protein
MTISGSSGHSGHSGGGAGPTDPSDLIASMQPSDRVAQARRQYEITAEGIVKLVKQVAGEDRVRDEFWPMLRSMVEACFTYGQNAGEASEGVVQMQEHLDGVQRQMELHEKQTELHGKSNDLAERGLEVTKQQLAAFERFATAMEAIEKKLEGKILVVAEKK